MALALYERLKAGEPVLMQISTVLGIIWAGLIVGSGNLMLYGFGQIFIVCFHHVIKNGPILNEKLYEQWRGTDEYKQNNHQNGFMIAQIFYGAWLFPLGYLVFKSGFLPRILGVILMVHCVAWLTTFFQFFLFPGYTAVTYISYPLGFIAEFGLTLWLLIKGVNVEQWEKSVLESA